MLSIASLTVAVVVFTMRLFIMEYTRWLPLQSVPRFQLVRRVHPRPGGASFEFRPPGGPRLLQGVFVDVQRREHPGQAPSLQNADPAHRGRKRR